MTFEKNINFLSFFFIFILCLAFSQEKSYEETSKEDKASAQKELEEKAMGLIEQIVKEPELIVENEKATVIDDPKRSVKKPDGTINPDYEVLPDGSDAIFESLVNLEKNRKRSAEELSKMGKEVVPLVVAALMNEGYNHREYLVWVLGELRDPRAVPFLLKYYQDAIQLAKMSELMEKTGETKKATSCKESADKMKKSAVSALRKISGLNFEDDFKSWRSWWKTIESKTEKIDLELYQTFFTETERPDENK